MADDERLKLLIAKNPKTGPIILAKLAKELDRDIRIAVVNNPNVTPEILHSFIKDSIFSVIIAIAENQKTLPEDLAEIAKQYENNIRIISAIINNPSTPREVLVKLALKACVNDW